MTTVLQARPRGFVNTPAVEQAAARALRFLKSGFSVHLRGQAGTGKTTLALHLADLLGRPIMLIFGDDELKSSDMIGNQAGYTRKQVVDNFIHTVVKVEDEMRQNWIDSRLTRACKEGFTLVYDEFNRSRPEVNNVLLSALEEKLLILPPNRQRSEYVRVHPQFRAIFTSNPEEYCGVHATQDALMDRLVTINMPEQDEHTQTEILVQKSGIDRLDGLRIVQVVKAFRDRATPQNLKEEENQKGAKSASSLRSCLMIAKVCGDNSIPIIAENPNFRDVCADVLLSRSGLEVERAKKILWGVIQELVGVRSQPNASGATLAIAHPSSEHALRVPVQDSGIVAHQVGDSSESGLSTDELVAPYEGEVYDLVEESQTGVLVSEIQLALDINRVQTIEALRSLLRKGKLMQREDRLYVARGDKES